ncbi:MAG TPA: flagellar hook-length control protein FliK [Clostridiales bacterium]|jgi:hypothetical protein|nr:flagellar hook-length control protein FliK [Clostridiales bacterium]
MLNEIVINDGLFGGAALAGVNRRQAGGAFQMGTGALSFADILLMLFAKGPMNPGQDGQETLLPSKEDEPSSEESVLKTYAPAVLGYLGLINNPVIINNESLARETAPEIATLVKSGMDIELFLSSVADTGLLDRIKSEALPILRQVQIVDQAFEAVTAVREPAEPKPALFVQAPETQVESPVPRAAREIAAKPAAAPLITEPQENYEAETPERPEAPGRDEILSVSFRRTGTASEARPWEELQRSVGEVKFRLSRGREEKSLPDEAVQGIKAAEVLSLKQTERTAPAVEEPEAPQRNYGIPEQIGTGILRRLREGKSEFTMRLRPERLGVITVKLIEESGKMTLRIEAARMETARLINRDLPALREAVGPMQVEVQEAVTAMPEPSQPGFYQLGTGGQQQFANNQPFNKGRSEPPAYELEPDPEEMPARPILASLGFDRYV